MLHRRTDIAICTLVLLYTIVTQINIATSHDTMPHDSSAFLHVLRLIVDNESCLVEEDDVSFRAAVETASRA